jgi:crenactin
LSSKKEFSVFGQDYGTSELKFGPATLGNVPDVLENRGYFPDTRSSMVRMTGGTDKRLLVVGPDVSNFVESKRDVAERMVYPMRSGVIERDDDRSWNVVKELSRYALLRHAPEGAGFQGLKCVAALSAAAPRYMYDKLFEIHKEINSEEGRTLVKAISVIPQPFAVAISQKLLACTVLEGGAGNTQIAPISSGMIFNALITMNRGGGDCDLIAAEILRDAGYGDLAREPKLVKLFKESVGLVPRSIKDVMADKQNKKFQVVFRIPNTRISIDLDASSWQRFLIGEFFFNPSDEVFGSYYRRGFPKPADAYSEGKVLSGTTDLADVVVQSVQKCSFEVQPALYHNIVLSGGGFAWRAPEPMADVAVDTPTKLKLMLESKGIEGVDVRLTANPVYNVWQGCIAYGLYIPDDFTWDWDAREGWMYLDKPAA